MITVRIGTIADREPIRRFYELTAYSGSATNSAVVFLAEDGEQIVGIVRLEREEGVDVLRGMRVIAQRQRQGIGTNLLRALSQHLGAQTCYCIAFAHLVGFYGQIGFGEITLEAAPVHLRQRINEYRDLGHVVTMMKRPSS